MFGQVLSKAPNGWRFRRVAVCATQHSFYSMLHRSRNCHYFDAEGHVACKRGLGSLALIEYLLVSR
jgi:hypothetical protein